MSYTVAIVAGVAFFALSIVVLGVWPGRALDRQMRDMAPTAPLLLTASEQRGRLVYGREGCAYCHTQQVRFLHADMQRFGAPTLAWETQVDYPHLWGTRRIGPDLARETAVHTEDWHYAHLFDPRALAPRSVMPAYRLLFDGSPLRPRQEARDLVAYLETLGRPRELAAPEGEARARDRCNCPGDAMAQMAFEAASINAHPARPRPAADGPALPPASDTRRGSNLYADRCAGCHGAGGLGDGPAAPWLSPRPADLTAHRYTRARLSDALWHGVAGTAMQAWRDHTVEDLAALATAVDRLASTDVDAADELGDQLARGAQVYLTHCAQCHGTDGDGRGSAAAQLRVAPTNFRRQRATASLTLAAIRDGVEGTQMAAWSGRLTADEQRAVAQYVRRFFVPDPSGPGAAE